MMVIILLAKNVKNIYEMASQNCKKFLAVFLIKVFLVNIS